MTNKAISILICLLIYFQINAQSDWASPFEIVNDTASEYFVPAEKLQLLFDSSGQLTFEQIQNESISQTFKQYDSQKNQPTPTAIWFRYKLINKSGNDINIALQTSSSKSEFYIVRDSNKVENYTSGYAVDWEEKSGLKLYNVIPFKIQMNKELQIYQKRYFSRGEELPSEFSINLLNSHKYLFDLAKDSETHSTASTNLLLAFFGGILVFASILNALIFFEIREKIYLFFSLFLLFVSFEFIAIFAEAFMPGNLLAPVVIKLSGLFNFVFLMHFNIYYFEVNKQYPRWNKFITIFSILICFYILHGIYEFLKYQVMWGSDILNLTFFIYLLVMVVSIIISLKKKTPKRKTFFLAISPFILTIVGVFLSIYMERSPSLILIDSVLGITLVWAVVVFSAFLYRNYRNQGKQILQEQLEKERIILDKQLERNEYIEQQKNQLEEQVVERTKELKESLEELKSTQSQLIHSEKMASLGELTAGIAHEIQNPLNFVNNFSEVSNELIDEMKFELSSGDLEEGLAIAEDIKQNLQKITHHGKRADAIVKGMLEHSRTNTGEKSITDINQLADEYLRLSYHGLRAKDKSFNANFTTDFDPNLPKINVIPQDIGRVLLNLINNAFQAVHSSTNHPEVKVGTKQSENEIQITISDNGVGIPANIKEKIFQPFYTTKPTGQGTGLGLSLSYDIIKAHGGQINVESIEGEGSTFTVILPIK